MSTVIEIGVYGGAIPLAVAFAIVYFAGRFSSSRQFERLAMAAAFAVAFFIGWMLLPNDWTPLSPQRPWHWLPYLGLLAAATSGPRSPRALLRLATYALIAASAAWLLAPDWPDMQPPRYVYVSAFAGYLFALMTLLDALPDRIVGPLFGFLLFAAAAGTALVVAEPVSLAYGQIAGVAAAALLGCAASACLSGGSESRRGLHAVYAVLVGGIAFTASIEPEPPMYAIMLAPLTPLALWTCAYGPASRLAGGKARSVQCAAVLLAIGLVAAWVLLGGEPDYAEYDY